MALSPMMRQYMQIKEENDDALLLFRLGDFYELFFEDAKTAANELELTLTGRDCGLAERAPMCGVPFHSADSYIERLIKKGYKVAICEQLSQPTKGAGIVERGIVRVITPGTFTTEGIPDSCYVMCVFKDEKNYGIAYSDVSTGEFKLFEAENLNNVFEQTLRLRPSEIIVSEGQLSLMKQIQEFASGVLVGKTTATHYTYSHAKDVLREKFGVDDIGIFEVGDMKAGIVAAGALMEYLKQTSRSFLMHITKMQPHRQVGNMVVDRYTERNLELLETMRDKKKKGSLLGIIDKTRTAMGSRLIKKWTLSPLTDKKKINNRLSAVSELKNSYSLRYEISQALNSISDIERLVSKLTLPAFAPRDVRLLIKSIGQFPAIKKCLLESKSDLLKKISLEIDTLDELHAFLESAIAPEEESVKFSEYIAKGFSVELDKFREAKNDGKAWILNLEAREREATGIKNLKISVIKCRLYI